MKLITFFALTTSALSVNKLIQTPRRIDHLLIHAEPSAADRCSANRARMIDKTNQKTYVDNIGSTNEFSDASFAADDSSLYWQQTPADLKKGNNSDVIKMYKNANWKRPKDFSTGTYPNLWGAKGVKPNGVSQGGLGDCWFLAAGSAIAEHPERIQEVFLNKEYSVSGIFGFKMYYIGQPVEFNIDDRLAVRDNELINA